MTYKSLNRRQPLCRSCGNPIPKATSTIWIYPTAPKHHNIHRFIVATPRTKEEAQKLVNEQVVSIQRSLDGQTIHRVGVWDGESYIDEYFCKGACAQAYAYMTVQSVRNQCQSVAYTDALKKQEAKT